MSIIDFVKQAGKALGVFDSDNVKKEVESHGFDLGDLDIQVDGDKVKVVGQPANAADREKIITALGNIEGVAQVEDEMAGDLTADFYTVQSGDTLSAISNEFYGDPNRYNDIFAANKPMLEHPDRIYPGQVLVIPPAD